MSGAGDRLRGVPQKRGTDMSTLTASIARVSSVSAGLVDRTGCSRRAGRPDARPAGGAVAVPLLVAGALAAGCGTAHAGAASGTRRRTFRRRGTRRRRPRRRRRPPPCRRSAAGRSRRASPPAWAGRRTRTSASLPVSFVPVSVERCVNGAQTIPGKGLWTTATLQRADTGLAGLINALRQPPGTHQPAPSAPPLAVIPPQVVLISASGQKLIPRLPVERLRAHPVPGARGAQRAPLAAGFRPPDRQDPRRDGAERSRAPRRTPSRR